MIGLNPYKVMKLQKIYYGIEKHQSKICKYCDMKLDNDMQVNNFLDHLIAEHPLMVNVEELKVFKQKIDRMFL